MVAIGLESSLELEQFPFGEEIMARDLTNNTDFLVKSHNFTEN